MTVGQLEQFLYDTYPKANQCQWDNTGLMCGDPDAEISRVLFALDITDAVIEQAERLGAQVIVAHHPLIREGLRKVTPQSDARVWRLCKAGIAAISMHTNLDISRGGVGDALAAAVGLLDPQPIFAVEEQEDLMFGRVGDVKEAAPEDFCRTVKAALDTPFVRAVCGERPITRVAVMGGSGRDYIEEAARCADAYVTADCRYHDFQLAQRLGLTLIDAGHFPTENVVIEPLMQAVAAAFPALALHRAEHTDVIGIF